MTNKKQIAIIDDDNMLKEALTDNLEGEGIVVSWYTSANQAFEAMRENKPDVILLDLVMADMDGFETLQVLNSDPDFDKVPVIILSNLGDKEHIDRAKDLGAKNFMVKAELSLKQITNRVKKVM